MLAAILLMLTVLQPEADRLEPSFDARAAATETEAVYHRWAPLAESLERAAAEAAQDQFVATQISGEGLRAENLHAHLQERRDARRARLRAVVADHDPVALIERAPQTANFLTRLVRADIDTSLNKQLMARFEPLAGTPALHESVYSALASAQANSEPDPAPELAPADPGIVSRFQHQRARHAELIAELGAATGRDQFVRAVFVPQLRALGSNAGPFIEAFSPVITQVDTQNAALARGLLEDPGFAALHATAPDAAERIVDLLHHGGSMQDRSRLLALIEPLALSGRFDGQAYALMYDRLAEAQGRPQRYGTQDACVAGRREIYSIEDPATVDERRAAFDMMALADYRTILIDQYGAEC